eukprot:scaffold153961_cov39-Tisochrysis_lutea.AAC.1
MTTRSPASGPGKCLGNPIGGGKTARPWGVMSPSSRRSAVEHGGKGVSRGDCGGAKTSSTWQSAIS